MEWLHNFIGQLFHTLSTAFSINIIIVETSDCSSLSSHDAAQRSGHRIGKVHRGYRDSYPSVTNDSILI